MLAAIESVCAIPRQLQKGPGEGRLWARTKAVLALSASHAYWQGSLRRRGKLAQRRRAEAAGAKHRGYMSAHTGGSVFVWSKPIHSKRRRASKARMALEFEGKPLSVGFNVHARCEFLCSGAD
jgi:hypothetical protein